MAFAVAKLERNREIERERERLRTHLDRLEDIHARMPGVALLALVPGLARGALLAANAVESLCEIVGHLSKAGSCNLLLLSATYRFSLVASIALLATLPSLTRRSRWTRWTCKEQREKGRDE